MRYAHFFLQIQKNPQRNRYTNSSLKLKAAAEYFFFVTEAATCFQPVRHLSKVQVNQSEGEPETDGNLDPILTQN